MNVGSASAASVSAPMLSFWTLAPHSVSGRSASSSLSVLGNAKLGIASLGAASLAAASLGAASVGVASLGATADAGASDASVPLLAAADPPAVLLQPTSASATTATSAGPTMRYRIRTPPQSMSAGARRPAVAQDSPLVRLAVRGRDERRRGHEPRAGIRERPEPARGRRPARPSRRRARMDPTDGRPRAGAPCRCHPARRPPSPAARYASTTIASVTRSGTSAATGSSAASSGARRRRDPAVGVVAIEAAAGLAPEPAALDEPLLETGRAEPLRQWVPGLERRRVERAGDGEVDVDADEVHQLERAHRVAGVPDRAIDGGRASSRRDPGPRAARA